ncbi:MAG: hypothetical protein I8H91_02780 [Burkholderiales bacterium]|nr:hypothetical protein [Burkholderiales bacterium]
MIVFLDFDGVLHPESVERKDELLCRLPLVEGVLREFAQARVVISSTWRLNWRDPSVSTLEMRKYFSPDMATRVVGVTPSHLDLDYRAAPGGLSLWKRQWECETWLCAHRPPGTPWLALDDRAGWFRPLCPNLMELDSLVAFTPGHCDEFRARLKDMQPQGDRA